MLLNNTYINDTTIYNMSSGNNILHIQLDIRCYQTITKLNHKLHQIITSPYVIIHKMLLYNDKSSIIQLSRVHHHTTFLLENIIKC